ncbi:protein FAM219B isoform X5 [Cygnus olor]|uniref:protein FAM219B isoform X5 n=1 Tax=Cygnus olor TaxID=8869 RepID=UPI001ADE1041|nr:protein FAM219B isoform X5 [Cygnus olor]
MGLGVSTGLCGAIWGYMGLGVRVGLCAWGAVWGWSVFVGQCGALRSRSGIGPERVYGAAWGCTRGAVRVEQHAAVQGCRHQGTGSGRGCVGQRPYRGRASTQGPHSAHRELCRVRPQLSPSPFQPPRGESRRPSTRGSDGAERRGPYLLCRPPAGHAKLQRPREPAKAAPRWHGLLGGPPAKAAAKRSARSRGGYVALSQVAEDSLASPSSGSDGELESRGSSGYSSAEASPAGEPGAEPAAAAGRLPPGRGP